MVSDPRQRSFRAVLVNTLIANITTSFLWYCVTFWMYLETRNVLVTAILGGSYMLGMALFGVPFGSWIDRTRKKRVMVVSQSVTAVFFALAAIVYFLSPREQLLTIGSFPFVAFVLLLLTGAIMESARGIALGTVVTLLVPDSERAKANGLVGMVGGLGFMITSVIAGLAIGQLGMTTSLIISLVLTAGSLAHMVTVAIPEPEIVHAEGAPKKVDFAGAWGAIREVPALIWLIVFSTFNNLIGGVYMALLDPYGLSLVSVEAWGIVFGFVGIGFIIGGAVIAKVGLGTRPLRALLLANVAMWIIGGTFAIRESIWFLIVGMLIYMAIIPFAEAAEQTVLQRVVPLPKQGRVFGFAQSIELAAAPFSSFLIGPIAEFWLIPYMNTPQGQAQWSWLLGEGHARGIALVFLLTSIVGLAITVAALASRPYRTLSAAYAASGPEDTSAAPPTTPDPPSSPEFPPPPRTEAPHAQD
ncbi:MAG TPA: MFS transporter [Propioniciclava sp.]|uniref:MFS transporter n=1 Tax=Propioniciclava sp. TaxID=2038686 RepID=UPI002C4EDDB6|nr:MFS transporter [Propioniciclava sp.]HRL49011.1 MFS transporter [Propioniciclava sp.]HRL80496.1 MFS transporter [Propioniciclava sp.]